jgi:two-component system CheB/CheR fusion protein
VPSNTDQFAVIGVGASAGGLAALTSLVSALPSKANLALIVVQHLDPRVESQLAPLLAVKTKLEVVEATHGAKLASGRIYVIQPNTDVAVADGLLSVTARQGQHRPHYPIDHLFRSLAAVHGEHAVGVVLSGTGSDGTLGLAEIKAAGGLTFAQDKSAEYAGMPNSAVAAGAVDLVLPPEDIAAKLAALPDHPYLSAPPTEPPGGAPPDEATFKHILQILRESSGVDFSQYRDTTLRRRTARRMVLRGVATLTDYAALLQEEDHEAAALYKDFLINVTSFFRDPELFEALKRVVFPAILEAKRGPHPIRVWVPGCSTGQEAYSVAIVLLEFLEAAGAHRPIQIFATDLGDPSILEKGRAGIYPLGIETEVSPERLRRYFTREGDAYRVVKPVREACVFARQNLTMDPPFSRVDLITCRNVLIYMSPALQQRLLPVFHFALNAGGFLVLGPSETVGLSGDLFELVNRAQKVYRKKGSPRRASLAFMADDRRLGHDALRAAPMPVILSDFHREADRLVAGSYGPPSVLVNHAGDIQQFRGRTAAFLEAPAGVPTTNVLRMASNAVFLPLRDALQEAQRTGAAVTRPGLHVSHAGRDIGFTLRVLPVAPAQTGEPWWLVVFDDGAPLAKESANTDSPSGGSDLSQLRKDLASSQSDLQLMLDQHDSATQDLRAAHEELLSSNEELQSTNEELETAKEELQSSNQELTSVNDQLHRRNLELDQLSNDLSNFISSARLPIVTVGPDLRIRRLTPAAQAVFNLLPSDVGRSLEHIKFSIDVTRPGDHVRAVMNTGQTWEHAGPDAQGRWWLLRAQPFLIGDGRIDGATIVAFDIDAVKRTGEIAEARDYAIAVLQTVREPLVVLDEHLKVGLANQAFYELCGTTADQMQGRHLYDTCSGIWNHDGLRDALQAARRGSPPLTDFEIMRDIPGRGLRALLLNARTIVREGHETLLLLAVEDVSDRRQAEALRVDTETLRLMNKRKDEFLGVLAHELRNPLAPMRFALELLHRGEADPEKAVQARQVLERQLAHVVRIVEDLLDVARITHGKVGLHRTPVDIRNVISSAVELCQPVINAAHHDLSVSMPEEGGGLIGDSVRLTQVVVNLLNNAVKFTPPGGRIQITVERHEEDDPEYPNQMRLSVRDSGIGIDSETLPRIFDMFVQGDSSLEGSKSEEHPSELQ